MHLLVDDLAHKDLLPKLEPNAQYEVWTPFDAYQAADALRRVLDEDRAKT